MNIELLKATAAQLKQVLQLRASKDTDNFASELLQALAPTLDAAIAGQITTPYRLGTVPCSYLFSNGDMRYKPDIEEAYSYFSIAMRGKSPIQSNSRHN